MDTSLLAGLDNTDYRARRNILAPEEPSVDLSAWSLVSRAKVMRDRLTGQPHERSLLSDEPSVDLSS
jgi:hypothetical protein